MDSLWSEAEAERVVSETASAGVARELALQLYASRLLGRERRLVLHGGGNTSYKTTLPDLSGDPTAALLVKGSGRDLAHLTLDGLTALRLEPLRRLEARAGLSDHEMVAHLRGHRLDPEAADASVEALLHAFLPAPVIDHSHAEAVLALTNQPDGAALCREVYGTRVALVPYFRPGFALAQAAAQALAANPAAEGLILLHHGIVSFGQSAREAYERMIALVTLAEARLAQGQRPVVSVALPARLAPLAEVAPIVRGALAQDLGDGLVRRQVLTFRRSAEILDYVNGAELARYSQAGVATPDHVIRTKGWPLLLPAPAADDLAAFKSATHDAAAAFRQRYQDYVARQNQRLGAAGEPPRTPLDPLARVVLVPGLGLFAAGKSAADAEIAADIAVSTIRTIRAAEGIGRFQSISEDELFEMEYWPPEQAKLGRLVEGPLARQVVLVTGGAGGIGRATAAAFKDAGAEVVLVDLDPEAAKAAAAGIGPRVLGLGGDVTDPASVRAVFDTASAHFGGLDIIVSNAGAAFQGQIGELSDQLLRQSFELNFFAHQTVSQNAIRVMRAQGTGGCLLYNVSKQAVNPGKNFGAYGLPKAATLFLSRQYALDHGREGIRTGAVNADRIRSGLLTPDMIAQRSAARGLDERQYMAGNLLGREVTAEDVAQAFVHQALALRTTASVTTVDGGNIEAALR